MQQNQGQNNQQNEEDDIEDEGIDVGTSKQSKIIIIIIITIFVSCVIYFMLLREPSEDTERVDNNEIVVTNDGVQPVRGGNIDYNAADILDVIPEDNLFSPKTQDTIPTLPELPQLPEEIKQQIANSVEKKEETFTKEEVDKMIEDKMKDMMEKQMQAMENMREQLQQQNEANKTSGVVLPVKPQKSTNNNDINLDDLYNPDDKTKPTIKANDGLLANNTGMSEEDLLAEQQRIEAENLAKIQKQRALQERRAAPIFKMSGGAGPANSLPQDSEAVILSFTDAKLDIQNKAPDVLPTQVTDLTRSILQGKVISAVLETAIDTDLASTVRAVITRDIYAEEGKNILIPRGSRVVGTYSTSVSAGQTRVTINWNRIIRVDGMSLNIASIGADRLGRAGVQGDLDNKYAQRLANSFLSSVLTVGATLVTEKLNNSTGISSTISSLTGETTTTSGKASDYALINAAQDFMDEAQDIVDSIAEQKPVIRIPQGEKVTIMVTQDVILPIFKRGI